MDGVLDLPQPIFDVPERAPVRNDATGGAIARADADRAWMDTQSVVPAFVSRSAICRPGPRFRRRASAILSSYSLLSRRCRMACFLRWSSLSHTAHRSSRGSSRRRTKEMHMPLISVVITLIVVGVLLWLVNAYIPMDGKIKQILNAVVIIAVVLWLLSAFGLIGDLGNIRVGRR